jgi:hypothetical protein
VRSKLGWQGGLRKVIGGRGRDEKGGEHWGLEKVVETMLPRGQQIRAGSRDEALFSLAGQENEGKRGCRELFKRRRGTNASL